MSNYALDHLDSENDYETYDETDDEYTYNLLSDKIDHYLDRSLAINANTEIANTNSYFINHLAFSTNHEMLDFWYNYSTTMLPDITATPSLQEELFLNIAEISTIAQSRFK